MKPYGKRSVRVETFDANALVAFPACQGDQVLRGRMPRNALTLIGLLSASLLLAGCSHPQQSEILPPPGFRAITESEYPEDWQLVADLFPTPDRAEGDFDGDSELDQARLWVRESGSGWVLMAYLSSRPDEPILVHESSRPLGPRPIRAIPPGEHKTDRYNGIGPGGPDTTAIVHLAHEAINLAWVESEGTTYIWNPDTGEFDSVGMY